MKLTLTIFLFFCVFGVNAQTITTFAGGGSVIGDGGGALSAHIVNPNGGVFDRFGNYYVASNLSGNRIRKIDVSCVITTIAGTGIAGYDIDGGMATTAKINTPSSVQVDSMGNIYIADANNCRIRKVDKLTGIITTIAGNGSIGYGGDGIAATSTSLQNPQDICLDKLGNLYIADANNNRIRKVNSLGVITTFAGTGVAGFLGDGGLAVAAQLWLPMGLAIDDTGNIYIADNGNARIRKVNTLGVISTIAGNGISTFVGDGVTATAAQIDPIRIAFNGDKELCLCDWRNNRVRWIDKYNIIHTIVGNGIAGYSGDGAAATASQIHYPAGIAFDSCGNIYISDASNNRVRKVDLPIIPSVISLTVPLSVPIGNTVTATALVTGAGSSYSIKWMNKGVLFATTTVPTVSYTKGAGIDSITATVIPASGCHPTAVSALHVVNSITTGIHVAISVTNEPVHIYPNPAQGELTITAGTKITGVTISNIIGRQVYSHEYNTENVTLNIAHLPAGVYTLKITGDGWQEVRKVVKE